ncbi:S49 family peptidase [Rhodobacter sp. CCP-1]|uniref:S49 family peptidase n=2 Tax=Paragemmobacter ruber TaxID=1985673 RepID=A0ABW9Y0L4_9RHOB|nr:S49 family peptidase [Rhodobacter ruber]
MALDLRRAQDLLALDQGDAMVAGLRRPAMALEANNGLRVEPGERFAVLRGVAVVPVRGILTHGSALYESWFGWATYSGIEDTAAQLAADADVTAVILDMNSPGGLVIGCEAAAEAIRSLRAVKPVHALVNPLAASAAYLIASQATSITMTPGALVGSIGTMTEVLQPVQPSLYGDQAFIITSSHARAKRPDPTTEVGRAELQRFADEAEARFHQAVSLGRGIALEELPALLSVTDDPADGGASYEFEAALARRLVDGRETRAAFYDRIFAQHGLQPRRPATGGRAALGAQAVAAAAKAIAAT